MLSPDQPQQWGLVACIMSEGGRVRMDSALLPVDVYSRDLPALIWTGSGHEPVLTFDGFSTVGEKLVLAFRLKAMHSSHAFARIALTKVYIETSTLLYTRNEDMVTNHMPRRNSISALDVTSPNPVQQERMEIPFGNGGSVHIRYVANSYADDANGIRIGCLNIYMLAMKWPEKSLRELVTQHGHKITCMIITDSDYNGHHETYIGRPQSIKTRGQCRWYQWGKQEELDTNEDNQTFRGTTQRDAGTEQRQLLMEEANDLRMIREKHQPARTDTARRRLTLVNLDFIHDNDAFRNTCIRLPINVLRQDTLTVTLYNFKYGPPFGPVHITLTLSWDDFTQCVAPVVTVVSKDPAPVTKSRRKLRIKNIKKPESSSLVSGTLERIILPHLTCRITFELNGVEKWIRISGIVFQVEEYDQTLAFHMVKKAIRP